MPDNLIAAAETTIDASPADVWDALTDPSAIRQYMFGTNVQTDWREGSPITWRGEWQGKQYEDRGVVLDVRPVKRIQYSHYSPLTGKPDIPDNYHTVTIELRDDEDRTRVVLTQDNNETEQAREHSENNWKMMLDALKQYVEQ